MTCRSTDRKTLDLGYIIMLFVTSSVTSVFLLLRAASVKYNNNTSSCNNRLYQVLL